MSGTWFSLPARIDGGPGRHMAKSVFISYSWEPEETKAWAEKLGNALKQTGFSVRLDCWDLRAGADLLKYMESAVRESDFVLLICTPEFAAKANAGAGGVGYEKRIVCGELYHGSPEEKFIPLLRAGDPAVALPSYLKSKLYVDFRENAEFESKFRGLASDLGSGPAPARHPEIPWEDSVSKRLDSTKRLFEFARSKSGLGMPKWRAQSWPEEWLDEWPAERIDEFIGAYGFARSTMKLGREAAQDFAFFWLREHNENEFYRYADIFEWLDSHRLRTSAAATGRLADELIRLDDAELQVFKKAYETARSMGRSRAQAEDYALDEAEVDYR